MTGSDKGASGRLAQAALIVATGVIASGVTGYLRDASVAASLGATSRADSFLIGYSWLDAVMATLGVSLAAAVVPALSPLTAGDGARRLGGAILIVVVACGLALMAVVFASSGSIVTVIAPGLPTSVRHLATNSMQIMSPGLVGLAFSGAASAVLWSRRQFLVPALSLSVFNAMVAAGALFVPGHSVLALSVVVTVASVAQACFLLTGLKGRVTFAWGDLATFRLALGFLSPAAVVFAGTLTSYLILVVDRAVASELGGGYVAQLNFSWRLATTLNQVLGVALATAAFPTLAAALARLDYPTLRLRIRSLLRMTAFVSLPALLLLIPWRLEIVDILYRHGAFTRQAAVQTADLTAFLLVGMAVDGLAQTLWRVIFGLRRSGIFLGVNVGQLGVHGLALALLVKGLGLNGIGAAASFGLAVQAGALFWVTTALVGPFARPREDTTALLKVGVASVPLGVISSLLAALVHGHRYLGILGLVASGSIGGVIVLYAASWMGIPEGQSILAMVLRGPRWMRALRVP